MLRSLVTAASARNAPTLTSFRTSSTKSAVAGATAEDITAARRWLAAFNPETIPRHICDVSFSRSSGPGGQNVNKVNSKATLRVPLSSLIPLVPVLLHPSIRASRYYAQKSDALIIQADDSRKQSDNTHLCFSKLCDMINEAAAKVVPGETSTAQQKRVRGLYVSDYALKEVGLILTVNQAKARQRGQNEAEENTQQ